MKKIKEKQPEKAWEQFALSQKLSDEQLESFKKYEALLTEWNEQFNLTAIKDLSGILRQHFEDSFALKDKMDLNKVKTVADIGSGAGFPSVPLKILYPHLKVLLMEVCKKKQKFLKALIEGLDLKDVEVCDLDWRTFLRTTEGNFDVFVTRAAINELELCRMFKPSSAYKEATLVYWASDEWQPHPRVEKFVKEAKQYKLGHRFRKLVFMGL